MFKLNIEKAKDLHRKRIRFAREERFKSLDTEFMKALESGDTQKIAEVTTLKQQLRDLPACDEIEGATCLDDLRNHWPAILQCNSPYT
jgi:uncharacterized protein YdcH (DUF465 family)